MVILRTKEVIEGLKGSGKWKQVSSGYNEAIIYWVETDRNFYKQAVRDATSFDDDNGDDFVNDQDKDDDLMTMVMVMRGEGGREGV
ncbi:hypothetical protein PoB_007577600 [Plakobranchus ocellatus]|uniref:Uncharacterized protein n=1 Tax=Plakobranchus ocellatus TaxID=259542 RepID=A0AAV4DZL4_9GAST|nr:hypothetical protein PoB_007577600 [Plakobranchus ocellatus]